MAKHPDRAEQRRYTRINLEDKALLRFTTGKYECTVLDLSLAGMKVTLHLGLILDRFCPVNIELKSQHSDMNFKASARVIRADEGGLAIEFTSMPDECYASLQTYLLYNAEDPFAISTEFPDGSPPFELIHRDRNEPC